MNVLIYFSQKRFVSLGEYIRRMARKNRNVNKFAQRKRDRKEQVKNVVHSRLYNLNCFIVFLSTILPLKG